MAYFPLNLSLLPECHQQNAMVSSFGWDFRGLMEYPLFYGAGGRVTKGKSLCAGQELMACHFRKRETRQDTLMKLLVFSPHF